MGFRWLYRHRRGGGVLALLGMAFYAVLIPWHTISQARIGLSDSSAPLEVKLPCHGMAARDAGKDSKPASKTKCPICTGYVALHLAVAPQPITLAKPSEAASASFEHLTQRSWARPRTAQSRAPPARSA
jgi:hypothetical protein